MTQPSNDWSRKRPMASIEAFIKAKLRPSTHEADETRLSCIYAHYRRWSHLTDHAPYSEKNFEAVLRKACRSKAPEEFRGELMFPFEVLVSFDEKQEKATKRQNREAVVIGEIELTRTLTYRAVVAKAGTTLKWVEPTDDEKRRLRELQSEFGHATGYIVAIFEGIRRYVPTDAIRRKL